MSFAIIGNGAIAHYVKHELTKRGCIIRAIVLRPERVAQMGHQNHDQPAVISDIRDMPKGVQHVIDCAGHSGLRTYGAAVLAAGYQLTTVSVGALADQEFYNSLAQAASEGNARLCLASGAIGALDCLRAAKVGGLHSVRYVGRKPPMGWIGSPAEDRLNLAALETPQRHFLGSARQAAIAYPKNANVAAAVALAGLGFETTEVELIADPNISTNIHEIIAEGLFGQFRFEISGKALPDNPSSSALAAMSVVASIEMQSAWILF
jgi:aspartate dehydrogenase